MRTIDATLAAALAGNYGAPVAYVTTWTTLGSVSVKKLLSYKLTGHKFYGRMDKPTNPSTEVYPQAGYTVKLFRGVNIGGVNGTDYLVETEKFWVEQAVMKDYLEFEATMFPSYKATVIDGHTPAEDIFFDVIEPLGYDEYYKSAEKWRSMVAYPEGRSFIVNKMTLFEPIFFGKYFVKFLPSGNLNEDTTSKEQVLAISQPYATFFSTPTTDLTLQIGDYITIQRDYLYTRRAYRWTDENGTIYKYPDEDYPMHNLGYVEAAEYPANMVFPYATTPAHSDFKVVMRPNLEIQNGDYIKVYYLTTSTSFVCQLTEVLDPWETKFPKWYMILENIPAIQNTEGGALPSTIENVSNYTPLNTSDFDNILSEANNNLQSAMDTLDDHTHAEVAFNKTGFDAGALDDLTISFDDGTRTFSITPPLLGSFSFWLNGTQYTYADTDEITITDTDGIWYIYYTLNAGLPSLTSSQTPWTFDNTKVFVAVLYWDATNNTCNFLAWEGHTWEMDDRTHELMHSTFGTRWASGLTVSINGNFLDVTGGVIYDEDLKITIVDDDTPDSPYEQALTYLTAPIFCRGGASGYWRRVAPDNVPVYRLSTVLQINLYTGSPATWQWQDVALNKYCAYWILATNDINYPIIIIPGQEEGDTLAAARSGNQLADMSFGDLPTPEAKVIARILVQRIAGAPYYSIAEVNDYRNAVDEPSGSFTAYDHGGLTGLADDDHSQYLLAAGTRGLSADWDAGSYEIRAQTFESDVATGTAPLVVASTTKVTNLNADLLDGESASAFADAVHTHTEADITDLDHDAVKLQGRTLVATAPNDGDAIVWDAGNSQWEPGEVSSAGDMTKAEYDTDDDGVVDDAAAVGGVTPSALALTLIADADTAAMRDTLQVGFQSLATGTINDDAAYSFTPNYLYGVIMIFGTTASTAAYYAEIHYRAAAAGSHMQNVAVGANVNSTTGALTGTTGTDGKVTLSSHTDGKIYIENRSGTGRAWRVVILGYYTD